MNITEDMTIVCDPSLMCCDEPLDPGPEMLASSPSHSYWDIYTDDQIPVLERAIGGALLPVVLVGSFFGAGCGGEEEPKVTTPQSPPVISPIPDKRVMASRPLSIEVSATDTDWNDTLTWTVAYRKLPNGNWNDALPSHASFYVDPCDYNSCHFNNESLANGTLTWEPRESQVGSYEFRFEISDGQLSDIKSCHIEVTPYVPPPPPPPPPPPGPPNSFDSCPQAVMNQEGTVVAAWMNRDVGRGQRLVMSKNASRLDKRIVGPTEANICDGNKAIDFVGETSARLCWKDGEALTCQTFTENGDAIDDAQQMALGNDGGYSMKAFEDGTFAMVWVSEGHVYLQIFAASGYPNTLPMDLGEGEAPDLDTAGDELIVAWITPPQTPYDKQVQVKKYSKTGEPLYMGWELINGILQRGSYSSDPSPEISVSMNQDRFFAIGAIGDRTGRKVFMGVYNMNGTQQTGYRNPDFPENDTFFVEVAHPRVVLNDAGFIHFSFSSNMCSGDNFIANGRYTYWNRLEPLEPIVTYGSRSDFDCYWMPGYALATNGVGMKLVYGLESPESSGDPFVAPFPLTTVSLADLPQEPVIPDGPSISGVGSTVDFGNVLINETSTVSLTFENRGREPLEIRVDPLPEEPFSVGSTFLTISPLGSRTFSVSFNPTEIGDHTGSLTLNTNDPENPTVTYSLFGHGGLL